jgi:hypothetical protein
MTSNRLLEDGDIRLDESGQYRVLEDGSLLSVGSAQWASRNFSRLANSRRLSR